MSTDHEPAKDRLEAARRATLSRIGSLNEQVMSRMTPVFNNGAGPKGCVIKFDCATIAIPPVSGLEELVGANGYIGGLVGIPYVGSELCAQAILAPEPANPKDAVWLLPLKLLTADEYDWAVGVQDGARAKALAAEFLKDSSRHFSWPDRPSILPRLK